MKNIHPLPCKVDAKTLEKVREHCRTQGIPVSSFIRSIIKEKFAESDLNDKL